MLNLGFGVGPGTAILVALAALLVFGPKKLPQLGKAAGSTLKEFKNATKGLVDDDDEIEEIEKIEKNDEK